MARTIKPPTPLLFDADVPSLFLAGSIEMGQAEPWQAHVEESLTDLGVTLLNPRRDEWDPAWAQSIDNPRFREQVEWELEAQEMASLIVMYFAPDTKAPITLLELGLAARSGKLLVCCPEGFWRKGNVEVLCAYYRIPLVDTLEEMIERIRRQLGA